MNDGKVRTLKGCKVAHTNEDGELILADCRVEFSLRNVGGVSQIMIMMQPEAERRLLEGHARRMRRTLSANEEDVQRRKIRGHDGEWGARWSRLKFEKVNL